jgi:hypothetical protein
MSHEIQYNGETFRDVPGYEGRYMVSESGVVVGMLRIGKFTKPGKSAESDTPVRIMTQTKSRCGYMRVSLVGFDGRDWSPGVHKVVALAFIPNPDRKRTVNHKDGDKTNNHVSNLEWMTYSENSFHAIATGLQLPMQGSKHPRSKLTEEDVIAIRRKRAAGGLLEQLGAEFKVTAALIGMICKRTIWRHVD